MFHLLLIDMLIHLVIDMMMLMKNGEHGSIE